MLRVIYTNKYKLLFGKIAYLQLCELQLSKSFCIHSGMHILVSACKKACFLQLLNRRQT